jgi:hypothetical protein
LWVFVRSAPEREYAPVFRETFYLSDDEQGTKTKTFPAHSYIEPPFELIVQLPWSSGEIMSLPVTITLNGKQIYSAVDFQQNASSIRREIDLLWENTLEIKNLKGKPGTAFTVLVRGKRARGYPGPARPSLME